MIELTVEESQRFAAWCEQETVAYADRALKASRLSTQVGNLVSQGHGLTAASLQVVSVMLGGDPVPAPPEPPPAPAAEPAPAQ